MTHKELLEAYRKLKQYEAKRRKMADWFESFKLSEVS